MKVDGVETAKADYTNGTAKVKVRKGTDPNTLCEAVTGQYSAKVRP